MRKTAFILALILILCSFGTACLADEVATAETAPVEKVRLSAENLNFLTGLGVLSDARDKFTDLSANATRAHAAYLAAKLTVTEFMSTEQYFSDVNSAHWAYGAVGTAVSSGIVSQADKFEPEGMVTLEQADKMFVCALGYTPRAESLGGYPVGYVQTANRLKLNENVVSTGILTVYDLLQMAANAAETDVMSIRSKIAQIRTLPRWYSKCACLARCEVINRCNLKPSIRLIPYSNRVYEQVYNVSAEILILDVSITELSKPPYNMFLF